MTSFPQADFSWSQKGAPARLLEVLNAHGEARFVGGCVRDSLLGLPPGPSGRTDIDIAAALLPGKIMDILAAAGIRHVPTGIDHGTVTAIIDHTPFEITTLRADIETDGRRAVVAFTEEWQGDAARRDFTINALYLSSAGEVVDYHEGQSDLEGRRVRFIGQAEDRIREDYLRILRFLRFSARYADRFDQAGWTACMRLSEGIEALSRERIWSETAKLFSAPGAPDAFAAAADSDVLARICPSEADTERFSILHALRQGDIAPALGLAALWPAAVRQEIQRAFKPSLAILDDMEAVKAASTRIDTQASPLEILYFYRRDIALWAADLRLAVTGDAIDTADLSILKGATKPVLPLKGADFVRRGLPKGPRIGAALKHFESRWIATGFPEDQETIDRLASEAVSAA
ncbi:MAG: CCA tRNA nucleotidyltransferase [Pseudomonadota bacterium]